MDIRSAAAFLSDSGSAILVYNNGASWSNDLVTTTGHVGTDLRYNFRRANRQAPY